MAFHWIGKSEDGKTVKLNNLETCRLSIPSYASPEWMQANKELLRMGVILDIETTGLNQNDDSIIEIAIRQFVFNKENGDILGKGKSYSSFEDPQRPISEEITRLTGITDEMVHNQTIDWDKVNSLLSESALIVAHNARFDRPFVDRKSKLSSEKVWACSMKQIDWAAKGFFSPKLELLNIYHGFFTDSHRALNDVDALLYLMSLTDTANQKPYLFELTSNARRIMSQVIATGAPFESKEHLKGRGYSWDTSNRVWSKVIFKDDLTKEVSWLEDAVYFGPFRGITRDIALNDGFKN